MKENCTQSWWCTVSPVSEYLQPLLSSRPHYHTSSVMISKADLSLVPSMCFTQEVASDSTWITIAAWIRGFPQIMIVENAESTESSITFIAHFIKVEV